MSNIPLLELHQVSKSFGNLPVLHDIDLTLNEGEILFLLGASGCGKTTLLRLIAGFEEANKGSMHIRHQVIFNEKNFTPPKDRRLGYVPQEGVLFPHLNVYRNIAYGLGNGKGKTAQEKQRIEKVMKLTGITELSDRMPHQISGGQQQRVALARALVPEPSIMLLDEPFSALDEHLREQIRKDIIDILRRSRSAAIIVTHDRTEALSSADKVGIIQEGHLMQLDSPEKIYRNPKTPDIASFLGNNLLLTAVMNPDRITAKCELSPRVPIRSIATDLSTCSCFEGKLLIRPDQLLPVHRNDSEALFLAKVHSIEFQGQTCQVEMYSNDLLITLNLNYNFANFKLQDTVGLKLMGTAIFYVGSI